MPIKSSAYALTFFTMLLSTVSNAALADPPARVGRLSYAEGEVSFHPGDQDQWTQAAINYPVTTGDAFWADSNGRGEIQIGSTQIRMDHMTQLDILQLDDNTTRINMPQGAVNVHLAAPPIGGSVQLITPGGEIDLSQPGTYDINAGQPSGAAPPNQMEVTALEGNAQVRGPRAALQVMQGETAIITSNPPSFNLQQASVTPFDDWAHGREQQEVAAQSQHYVSPHMTGYEDLDHYGQWSNDPSYGAVWYPTAVESEWAPYRDGHWAFVQPWGWTWVDDAPWGFAPFHYGRWIHNGPRWGWVPGQVVERPVYAPALVAFVGGSGWGISISSGSPAIGWVPLAPREVFHPYYPVSNNYVRNINITNVDRATINNINIHDTRNVTYANQQAATVVPSAAFTRGEQVHKSFMRVSAQQLQSAPAATNLQHFQPEMHAQPAAAPSARRDIAYPHAAPHMQSAVTPAATHSQQVTPNRVEAPAVAYQAPQPHNVERHEEPARVQSENVPHPEHTGFVDRVPQPQHNPRPVYAEHLEPHVAPTARPTATPHPEAEHGPKPEEHAPDQHDEHRQDR